MPYASEKKRSGPHGSRCFDQIEGGGRLSDNCPSVFQMRDGIWKEMSAQTPRVMESRKKHMQELLVDVKKRGDTDSRGTNAGG